MPVIRSFILLAALLTSAVCQADWQFRGHGKLLLSHTEYQSDDIIPLVTGDTSLDDVTANARLMAGNRWGRYDVNIDYQLVGIGGGILKVPATASLLGLSTIPSDDSRLFDLTHVLSDTPDGQWYQRLDRLNIGYAGHHLVWRFGRQAVSWGNGLAFNPMDIFNPFSPLAIDTDYKTGDDMLYAQWLFDSGDDLQFIYLPRRNPTSGELDATRDSTAMKLRMMTDTGDWDLLLGRHYDEELLAIGHVSDVGGAVWRLDANVTQLTDGRRALFAMTNMDYSWVGFGHNFYGFVEYYHNSLGAESIELTSIDAALMSRLQRGEIFALGSDELALGLMMEITPRWQGNATLIRNLHDHSSMLSLVGTYDWRQDTKLLFGAQAGLGARGSEYGGVAFTDPVSMLSGYAGTGTRLYLYVQQYY